MNPEVPASPASERAARYVLAGLPGAGRAAFACAVTQNTIPMSIQAVAASVLTFFITFSGMAAGPRTVGLLSDGLVATRGEEGLRSARAPVLSVSRVGAAFIARAAGSLPADLEGRA